MPGFFVSNEAIALELKNRYPERCVAEEMNVSGVTAKRNTLNKFMQDKAFEENTDLIVVAEGYLLNKRALFEEYHVQTVAALVSKMYMLDGEQFFGKFRGVFSGALHDKKKNKWLVFTNQFGDSPVFYTHWNGGFFAGSQVNYVLDACRQTKKPLTFHEAAAYQMLTFAFMEGEDTYAQEIKRLRGGTYLCVEDGMVTVKEYHRFRKHPERFASKTEEELVDILDEGFRAAIQLEYQKDEEYGYRHLTDMSGGLDSRMNAWVAHEMQPRHLQLLTYCKANYADELIAKEIAAWWGDELLVKPLDDCAFLYEIDELVFMNGGLSLFSGITGGKRMLESLNTGIYGLEHTGMLGDVVIGSFLSQPEDNAAHRPTGKYSEKLRERLKLSNHDEFEDHELYLLYARGFRGAMNTHLIRSNYTDVASPFLNVDFFQLCMDIPVELRCGHRLYKKWIAEKYPAAAKFKWETTGGRITEHKWITLIRKILTRGPAKLARKLGLNRFSKENMNPLDYWYATDEKLRDYLDSYAEAVYVYLPDSVSRQLIADMKDLYNTGNVLEKTMVLTVLGAAKMYFG